MSRKIERLINLTIALLATKRYLTKSEIFRSVEGYEGNAETKERMFERDKDDLRSLGISIEVGSFDPLFNDEAGYRIKQESYQLDLGEITSAEISLLSLAAQAWQGASFDDAAQRALLKLNSMGVPVSSSEFIGSVAKIYDGGEDLPLITQAIAASQVLKFSYRSSDLTLQLRQVVPIGLATRSGHWYISGVDQDVEELRTFRMDRIEGQIELLKTPKGFEAPTGFDPKKIFETSPINEVAVLDIRKGRGRSLRALATSTSEIGEWDRIKVPVLNLSTLASLILWHGEDVFVLEPKALKDLVVKELEALVATHG